ncbi:SAF domain-containing protein [Kocuria sp.]|uniref:SAF domain-containing protein n=1 Tax=Kocuria sp. TaxID=1871328 RepID=UPI0028111FBE|nr:SAF domain-containing protein [Kocuria sp.]HST72433.1 SAF domain-containing protein [Kocuria rosea]
MSRRPRPARRRYPLALHLRSALSRRRRLAAAGLLGLALALVVVSLAPPRARTVPVVTAAGALAAGTVVSAEQLAVAAYPHGLVPEGALTDPEELVGRTLAGAAAPGQPLTETALVGPGLLTGRPPGVTAVTLRIDDPGALRHVRAGDHVDVVHLPDAAVAERQVLGRGLPVLWVSAGGPDEDAGLLSGTSGADDRGLLVVGAPHEDAAQLAGAGGGGRTTVVLVPAPLSPSAEGAGP